ncbi:biotin--[acetyl-CoA-carboxylase] ligase [Actinomycetospora cinnamomea]|uniref:biotin--[biotin carboxyl-carrier protein] ligase n=1 Tax=Actinomycetospora cinnamomea TaxID=663609 RepID=A0A2U1FRZ4_9PSEU|nr:biotin--[acetyl-CoA-carboxylase] ligase [Actinomycetospora cinnamomea]PVZ14938.1 BirA family biotin operon repressor/biotin-[acetyl-CoA-carboxylase] ligase [Actinomycetospora cinnamomea]
MEAAPLDRDALRRALAPPSGPWASLEVVTRTGSTNADLAARAADPATPDRTVLVAEHQDAGRGRRDRVWSDRAGEGLTFSVLLRPREVAVERWGWAPLLAGLALVEAVGEVTGGDVPAALKWPNDLLLGPGQGKGAGVLAEVAEGGDERALVVGIGLNVGTAAADLPAGGTSLAAEGAGHLGRETVLVAVLRALADLDGRWRSAYGDVAAAGLVDDYRARCATLGREVTVTLPGGRVLEGRAVDVDRDGRLAVRDTGGDTTVVSAGDVVHVRPAGR